MPDAYRQCFFLNERGEQCESWFKAVDSSKMCPAHREIITPNGHLSVENTPKYIDLVNDERNYCYHFLDGRAQEQSQKLIFEFTDDSEGSVFEKIDRHIGFIEKVLEDMKARLHSARAVRGEKLDKLSEDERKELRKYKVDKIARNPEKQKTQSFKADPVAFLAKKQGMSKEDASALLTMDEDALLAKFARAKADKAQANKGE